MFHLVRSGWNKGKKGLAGKLSFLFGIRTLKQRKYCCYTESSRMHLRSTATLCCKQDQRHSCVLPFDRLTTNMYLVHQVSLTCRSSALRLTGCWSACFGVLVSVEMLGLASTEGCRSRTTAAARPPAGLAFPRGPSGRLHGLKRGVMLMFTLRRALQCYFTAA